MTRARTSVKDLSRRIERASTSIDPTVLKDATRAYLKLPIQDRMELAHEIVETRRQDFCRAYRNVVAVTFGFKSQRGGRGRKGLILREPCVQFIVRRKWAQKKLRDPQRLPDCLFAFAPIEGGRRVMCAIPTDVVIEKRFHFARAHAGTGIVADTPSDADSTPGFGNIACAVKITVGSSQTITSLSCRHVLSPLVDVSDGKVSGGAEVYFGDQFDAGPKIGAALTVGGLIRPEPELSFDVQLAALARPDALRRCLGSITLSASSLFIQDRAAFVKAAARSNFRILVSPNNPNPKRIQRTESIVAEFSGFLDEQFSIEYPPVRVNGRIKTIRVVHSRILEFRLLSKTPTLEGDSGSPVVVRAADGNLSLVGMHIAGTSHDGDDFSWVIPAWHLFDASKYIGLQSGATLEPVNPL